MGLRGLSYLKDYCCFFITTTCKDWMNLLVNEDCIKLLYNSLLFVNNRYTAHIVGYVYIQNHIHLIIYFPQENKLSDYMRDFKKFTSCQIRKIIENKEGAEAIEKLRYSLGNRKFKVWMDRFDDVVIKSSKILEIKLNYIHYKHSCAAYYFKGTAPLIPLLHCSELF